jgi:hypothetical protein
MPIPSFKAYLSLCEDTLPSSVLSWAEPRARALSPSERGLLRSYSNAAHGDINIFLRNTHLTPTDLDNLGWDSHAKTAAAHLNMMRGAATVLDRIFTKFAIPTTLTVYRGTTLDIFPDSTPERLLGKTYTLGGYTSTSTSRQVARGFHGGTLLVLTVPKGAHAIPLTPQLSANPHEAEVLLPKNTRIHVTDVGVAQDFGKDLSWGLPDDLVVFATVVH